MPQELRVALIEFAKRVPGVEFRGEVTDRAGRRGIAVARTTDERPGQPRTVLTVDPATGTLLAEERVNLERVDMIDAEPPVSTQSTVYFTSRVVTTLPPLTPTPTRIRRPTP